MDPRITRFFPPAGPTGSLVDIHVADMPDEVIYTDAYIDQLQAPVRRVLIDTNNVAILTVEVPHGASTGRLLLFITKYGRSGPYELSPGTFTVTPAGMPAVTGLSPFRVIKGNTVTLFGTNLEQIRDVKLAVTTMPMVTSNFSNYTFGVPSNFAAGGYTLDVTDTQGRKVETRGLSVDVRAAAEWLDTP